MKKLIKELINLKNNILTWYGKKFTKLMPQQSANTLFIVCCDNKAIPNIFTSNDLKSLFIWRNNGNLITPCHCKSQDHCEINDFVATLNFSILNLKVKNIIICGHSECEAMQTLMEQASGDACPPMLQNTWLKYIASSDEKFKKNILKTTNLSPCNLLSRINVIQQLDNLKTYPLVMEQLQNNKLQMHGWWLDTTTANIYNYDPNFADFILINEQEAKIHCL